MEVSQFDGSVVNDRIQDIMFAGGRYLANSSPGNPLRSDSQIGKGAQIITRAHLLLRWPRRVV